MKKVTFTILIIIIVGLLAYYYAERKNISLIHRNSEITEKVYFFDNKPNNDKVIEDSKPAVEITSEAESNLEI